MRYLKFLIVISLLSPVFASAQIFTKNVKSPATVTVEGKVFDEVSGTALNQARVTVFDDMMKASLAQAETDASGSYKIKVPKMARYRVLAEKATYFDSEQILSPADGPLQANLGLGRKSGYEFDITIFDKAYEHNTINTLRDCKVEIYNNTTAEQVLTKKKLACLIVMKNKEIT